MKLIQMIDNSFSYPIHHHLLYLVYVDGSLAQFTIIQLVSNNGDFPNGLDLWPPNTSYPSCPPTTKNQQSEAHLLAVVVVHMQEVEVIVVVVVVA